MRTHDVIAPKRLDASLGKGWKWSNRYRCQVKSNMHSMRVMDKSVVFRINKSRNGKKWIYVDPPSTPDDYAVLKMVMLTHFPDAIKALDGCYRARL